MSPSKSDLLPQLAALVSGHLAPQAVADGKWDEIMQLAIRQGLGPMLLWVIQAQIEATPAATRFKPLVNSSRIAQFNAKLLRDSQAEVLAVLIKAGIQAVWIKGFALARTVYPQPHLRPMDDLDLLVPFEQRTAALEAVQALGYQIDAEDALAKKLPLPDHLAHHSHLIGWQSGHVILEVHFRLLGEDGLNPLPEPQLGWFWEQTQTFTDATGDFTLFKPEAHLIYLCAHAISQHGEANFRLQRYFDLHLLITKNELDWDLVVARAVDLHWSYAVERALTLARQYFATPIPDWVLDELKNRRSADEDTRHVTRLQGEGIRWEETLRSLSEYSLRERLRRLLHLAFPPPSYMRARYAIPPGGRLGLYYLYRWRDAGWQILNATLRRLR